MGMKIVGINDGDIFGAGPERQSLTEVLRSLFFSFIGVPFRVIKEPLSYVLKDFFM